MNIEINEEVKDRIIQYLTSLESVIKSSGDFVVEQTPIVIQEYITYNRAYSTSAFIVGVILIISGIISANNGIKIGIKEENPRCIPFILLGVISIFIGAVWSSSNFDNMLKSWTAPRVLVIEEINSLIKDNKKN